MAKQINPIQNLFPDIKKIMDFIVIKNKNEADKNETSETQRESQLWLGALTKMDTYVTYKQLYTLQMFQDITPNVKFVEVEYWLSNIFNVPLIYRDHLLECGRNIILNNYVEKNEYYRMLNGLPTLDEIEQKTYVKLSDTLCLLYNVPSGTGAHELTLSSANKYIITDEYLEALKTYPDKNYLKYLGIYQIDIMIARKAKDFQLIRYIPIDRTDINPYIIKDFSELYNKYRDYVMLSLYNAELEDLYENYRTFMSLLITIYVLVHMCNKAVEHGTDRRFFDDTIIDTIFEMYSIPKSIILSNSVRRELSININKLIQKKATNTVFYDLIKILGYTDVNLNKLLLMKEQKYDEDGNPLFSDGTLITPENMHLLTTINSDTNLPEKQIDSHIYFQGVDIKSDNAYYEITNYQSKEYTYDEVTEPDPRWWELQDTKDLINNKHYTTSESKYIAVETVINQTDYLFETVYFMRMILDNKEFLGEFKLSVPSIFGSQVFSLFDLMLYLLVASCEEAGLEGEIITTASGLLAVAGFNFDIDFTLLKEFLETTDYVDKEKYLEIMSNLTIKTSADISRLFNEVMLPLRDWLTEEIARPLNRQEYLEYEKLYRATFTYDIVRDVFVDGFVTPSAQIATKYDITDTELLALQLFYPHRPSGSVITIDDFEGSQYNPFIGVESHLQKHWYISVLKNGVITPIYFYDILNRKDVRFFNDGTKDAVWWNGDVTDTVVVNSVINELNSLPADELRNAYFKILTQIPNSNNEAYYPNELLPITIRNDIFKNILIDKVTMDTAGMAEAPTTYSEFLKRSNPTLYALLSKHDIEHTEFMSDMMSIVVAIEEYLDMRLKHFEQHIAGLEMYFKPLITLIRYFKSYMVDFTSASIRWIFDDKIDAGGNSNMLKLFDEIHNQVFHTIFAGYGTNVEFGLYDAKLNMGLQTLYKDGVSKNTDLYNVHGTKIHKRPQSAGTDIMRDECIFFINGKREDMNQPSNWISGTKDVGRFVDESNYNMKDYKTTQHIEHAPIDYDAWKNFVEQ